MRSKFLGRAFRGSAPGEWHETANGDYVRIWNDKVTVTVFKRGSGWSGVSNIFEEARFTRRLRGTPKAAVELVLQAEAEGPDSTLWAPPRTTDWRPSKPKNGCPGLWRQLDGIILMVRQCERDPSGYYPASWFATIGIGTSWPMVAADGRQWFDSAEEAMMAADDEYQRRRQRGMK